MGDAAAMAWGVFAVVLVVAAALSAGLIVALRPVPRALRAGAPERALLAQAADAAGRRHRGGGGDARGPLARRRALVRRPRRRTRQLLALSAAAVVLALVGAVDDIRGLGPVPRLLIQVVAVGIVIAALPARLQIVPQLPRWLERALLLLGGVWFVNLVNFMDGIDWMTVAEVVPVTRGRRAARRSSARRRRPAVLVALALLGAIDRLCAVQPPGRAAVSRRRRQPADRAACSAGSC